jgi:SMI1-KNR4 cell-wall
MSNFSTAHEDVARLFRSAAAGAGGADVVPRPATPAQIETAERALGSALPESFRQFQLEFGDCQYAPVDIYRVLPAEPPALNLVSINLDARTEMGPRLPSFLIAFSDDGGGNYFCFDTRAASESEAPVVVWDHELDEDQTPDLVAPSFVEWLRRELEERIDEEQDFREEWQGNVINAFAKDLLNRFRGGGGKQ